MIFFRLFLLQLIIITALFSESKITLTPEEKNFLDSAQPLKFHNETNWPPYNFNENGVPRGFSIDYMRLLAKKLDIKIEFVSGYTWDQFMQLLKDDKIDAIINIAKNSERSAIYDFTEIFHSASNAIYVRKGYEYLDSLKKLEGKTIVMPKGFYAQQHIQKYYPNIKQILVEDSLEALKILSLGKADATIDKKNVLDYIISTQNISGVSVSNYVEDERMVSLIRIATSKNKPLLNSILIKAQQSVSEQELLELKRKWFGVNEIKIDKSKFLSNEEKEYLSNHKYLNMCSITNIKPIEFTEDLRTKGISVDLLKIIEEKLDIVIVDKKVSSITQAQNLLKKGECDIVPTILRDSDFRNYANLTKSLFSYKMAIVTQKGNSIIENLQDVSNKSMAKKGNSEFIKFIKFNYPNINILETKNDYETLEAVNSNKVYFAIEPLPVVLYYMSKYALNNMFISQYLDIPFTATIAVSKNNPILLSILNKSIEQLNENDQLNVLNKWTNISISEPFDYSFLWQIGMVLFIIILIIFYRQITLKKHNEELKLANNKIEEKTKELELLTQNLEFRVEEEIKKNEEKTTQLIQQSRLAQMGEMLSMIAHQWRQPLTAISATANNLLLKTILDKKIESDELKNELELINDYSQHLSLTIDDFRNFFKSDKEKNLCRIDLIIEKSLNIIKTSIEANEIELSTNYISQKELNVYETELQQVILNILKNAEDVLMEKSSYRCIKIKTYENSENVFIEIKDNGGGINPNIINKIFDPYFSTKTSNEGTGLGLYMSKTIINEHLNGTLSVKNDENGAVFTIRLPIK